MSAGSVSALTLQEMLHLKGLDEHLADRLYRVLKGDSGGVTYEKLLIRMASVVKVSSARIKQQFALLYSVMAPH